MHTIFDEPTHAPVPYQQPALYIIEEFAKRIVGHTPWTIGVDDLDMIFRTMPAYAIIGVWVSVNFVYNVGMVLADIRPELSKEMSTPTGPCPLSIDTTLVVQHVPHVADCFFGSFIEPREALDTIRRLPMHAAKRHTLN